MRWRVWVSLCLIAPTATAYAQADRWRPIYSEPGVLTAAVDTTRLVPGERGATRVLGVWLEWTFAKPQKIGAGKPFVTSKTHYLVSCKPLAHVADFEARYNAKGEEVFALDGRTYPESVLPLEEAVPD